MKAKKSTIPVYWEKHLNAWSETHLTQASYCKKNQLKVHLFGYYKRRQAELNRRQQIAGSGFIQLTPQTTASVKQPSLCLHLSQKKSIKGITSETLHLVQPLLACLA